MNFKNKVNGNYLKNESITWADKHYKFFLHKILQQLNRQKNKALITDSNIMIQKLSIVENTLFSQQNKCTVYENLIIQSKPGK